MCINQFKDLKHNMDESMSDIQRKKHNAYRPLVPMMFTTEGLIFLVVMPTFVASTHLVPILVAANLLVMTDKIARMEGFQNMDTLPIQGRTYKTHNLNTLPTDIHPGGHSILF